MPPAWLDFRLCARNPEGPDEPEAPNLAKPVKQSSLKPEPQS